MLFMCCVFSQLFYDGYQQVAVQLSGIIKTQPACPPSDKLQHIVKLGLEAQEGNCRGRLPLTSDIRLSKIAMRSFQLERTLLRR